MNLLVILISLGLFLLTCGFYEMTKDLKSRNKTLDDGTKTKYHIIPFIFTIIMVIISIWYLYLGINN